MISYENDIAIPEWFVNFELSDNSQSGLFGTAEKLVWIGLRLCRNESRTKLLQLLSNGFSSKQRKTCNLNFLFGYNFTLSKYVTHPEQENASKAVPLPGANEILLSLANLRPCALLVIIIWYCVLGFKTAFLAKRIIDDSSTLFALFLEFSQVS